MNRLNAAWHEEHKMPKNPTLDQRIAWHLEHAKHCGCREISGKLKEEMENRGIRIPKHKPAKAPQSPGR